MKFTSEQRNRLYDVVLAECHDTSPWTIVALVCDTIESWSVPEPPSRRQDDELAEFLELVAQRLLALEAWQSEHVERHNDRSAFLW